MKRFLLKTVLIVTLFFSLLLSGLVGVSVFVERNHFENQHTEGNLLVIKANHHYDLAFLGISHARMFSRYGNHPKVEAILGKGLLNLGRGGGSCGVNEQLFYLQYAYSQGVKIDTLVYVVSPVLMYAGFLNRATDTFNSEPFNFGFLWQYINFPAENKQVRIWSYMRSKFGPHWVRTVPDTKEAMTDTLTDLDTLVVQQGFKDSYKDGFNDTIFQYNAKQMEATIALAEQYNTAVVFIFPPALFGQWPAHAETLAYFQRLGKPCFDFSEVIKEPRLYYDNHHLNTKGVVLFTDSFLRPVLGR
ncbi:hypothetical protein BH09BAC1_BH09BAC1_25890 [soil metagenome]